MKYAAVEGGGEAIDKVIYYSYRIGRNVSKTRRLLSIIKQKKPKTSVKVFLTNSKSSDLIFKYLLISKRKKVL